MANGQAMAASAAPSVLRACCYLVWLSWQRQARAARQMVWIALALLALAIVLVVVCTFGRFWDMRSWRYRLFFTTTTTTNTTTATNPWTDLSSKEVLAVPRLGANGSPDLAVAGALVVALNHSPDQHWESASASRGEWVDRTQMLALSWPRLGAPGGADLAVLGAVQQALDHSAFWVFTQTIVLGLFFGFLLPVWSLAFASEALGGDRENNSLIWLLSRPIPRPAIYLAKYLAQLPWSATLNLGGFAILCLFAGAPGRQALRLFWPAVLWATLAFTALFHLFGAFFRRPAVLAIIYTFFLEIILNLMPGYLKRVSLSFYARCLVYDEGGPFGVVPDNPVNYLPVTGSTAQMVLAGTTLLLLVLGAWFFARTQIADGV